MTIAEFLEARIAEDEAAARAVIATVAPDAWENPTKWGNFFPAEVAFYDVQTPARVLAECAAKRAIIKQHEEWPVLVDQPTPGSMDSIISTDLGSLSMVVSKRMAWLTEREYVKRFGVEPPTAPMIAALAAVYSDHPDYNKDWAL